MQTRAQMCGEMCGEADMENPRFMVQLKIPETPVTSETPPFNYASFSILNTIQYNTIQ